MITEQEYKVHFQRHQQKYIRVTVLNSNDIAVDRIEGKVIDGNININVDSAIRRTCDLKLVFNNNFIPSPSSQIWLTRKIKMEIGIKSIITNEIVWFEQGIFLIDEPEVNVSTTEKTISIKGLDKMSNFDGTFNGLLDMPDTGIPVGTPIHEAIKTVVKQLGKEDKYLIEENRDENGIIRVTPYTLEKDLGGNLYEILKELCNLYMPFQIYYDVKGRFIFEKYKDRVNDSIIFNFEDYDFALNSSTKSDFKNVKNIIKVFGKLKEDGSQAIATVRNDDVNNQFSTVNIGERVLPISADKYYNSDQCQSRAEWELFKHSNFNEKISITSVPIYFLDVNKIINFNKAEKNLVGKYLIDSINFGLKYDSTMSINAHKLYN